MKKKIQFSLVYRDMFQSSGKYQPRKDQLERVAPAIIRMGCFARVETNGGAFEQVNLLYGENPNQAVRAFTKPFNEVGIKTHMLDRGLNALRMFPVPADVRKLMYHVKHAQGVDIPRIFCGLNDVRNIIPSIHYALDAGMTPQATLCITTSPIHTAEYYSEIADKQKKRDAIRRNMVDGILDSVGSLVGIGKTATLEMEYKLLAQEYDRLKKAFRPTVIKEVEKQTKELALEKQKAEAQRDNVIAQSCSIASERDKAIKELNSLNENVQLRINNAVKLANAEKDKTISRLQGELNSRKLVFAIIADMLYAASEVFKRAIDAIIHYSTDKYKSIFGSDEAADIKSVMQSYGKTKEQQQTIGRWLCDYADSRQSFDKIKHRQTYKEVADVANGAYDWKIEQNQVGIRR